MRIIGPAVKQRDLSTFTFALGALGTMGSFGGKTADHRPRITSRVKVFKHNWLVNVHECIGWTHLVDAVECIKLLNLPKFPYFPSHPLIILINIKLYMSRLPPMNQLQPFLLFSLGPPSWMLPQTFQGELYHPTLIWSEPNSPDSWLNAWQAKLIQQHEIWRVVSSSWLICLVHLDHSWANQASTGPQSVVSWCVKEKIWCSLSPLSPMLWYIVPAVGNVSR